EKDYRNADRNQRKENQRYQITRKDIGVKTDRERHHASDVANDLDWNHQGGQNRHRPGEMLRVFQHTLFSDSMPVIVKPGDDRQPQRHRWSGSWRYESGHEA